MPKRAPTGKAKKAGAAKNAKQRARDNRPTRAERLEAARRERNRRVLFGRVAIAGVLVIAIVGALGFVVVNRAREAAWISATEAGTCAFDRRADTDAGSGRNHIENATYRINPPAGGNHHPQPMPAGVYDIEAVPDDGRLVHSLEHGYVILWYQPDLAEDSLEDVLGVRGQFERDTLVVPRPSQPVPVAATAWHQRLLCDEVEPDALAAFVRNARNKGPEDVPH